MSEHYLLYTSDREHGGVNILGVFDTWDEARQQYLKENPDESDRYYNLCFIEKWDGAKRVD